MKDVTIITLVRQDRTGLTLSRGSVLAQQYPHIRHVIVPAPSTDGSEEMARDWEARGEVEVWSGAPKGIYPAMNWALRRTSDDDAVLFLNSGDFFLYEHAVVDLVTAAVESNSPWATGSFVALGPGGWIRGVAGRSVTKGVADAGHQATLVNARLLKELGSFDTTYLVFADGKLLRRVGRMYHPGIVSAPIVSYALGGFSTMHPAIVNRELKRLEQEEPTMSGAAATTSLQAKRTKINRYGQASAHRLLAYRLLSPTLMRTHFHKRRQIDRWMTEYPHWDHPRADSDSLLCCLDFLPCLLRPECDGGGMSSPDPG